MANPAAHSSATAACSEVTGAKDTRSLIADMMR
jgi:hypothetical protein